MAEGREISSFECVVCGTTLETWNTAWVPSYRLIIGPVRMPNDPKRASEVDPGFWTGGLGGADAVPF